MRVKNKLGLLFTGSLLITLSVSTIVTYFYATIISDNDFYKFSQIRNFNVNEFLQIEEVAPDSFDKIITREGAYFIVFQNEKIIFPDTLIGKEGEFQNIDLLSIYSSNKQTYDFSLCESFYNSRADLRMTMFIYRDKQKRDSFMIEKVFFITVIAITFIMFIISSYVLSRTAKGLGPLEKAVKEISKGNLEHKVEAKGEPEIAELARHFDNMRLSLIKQKKTNARMIMAVTHDLKTPLTSIKGYLEAIGDGYAANDPEKLTKYINVITNKTDLLEDRISDLIKFVLMKSNVFMVYKNEVNVKEFLQLICKMFTEDSKINNSRFTFNLDFPDDLILEIDTNAVTRVFENIYTNAVRYCGKNCHISLIAHMNVDNKLVIEVIDNGPGIAPENIPKIFESFYRVAEDRNSPGMGLGLTVVKSVIEAHDWNVNVDSVVGEGTTFTITC